MEEYGLDELAASAESVLAGLGPLAAGLARLAGEACRAVTLDAMELLVIELGRELLRGLVQLALDAQAEREVRLPQVTGADGVPRTRAEPGHARQPLSNRAQLNDPRLEEAGEAVRYLLLIGHRVCPFPRRCGGRRRPCHHAIIPRPRLRQRPQ